jgi:ubiquinone/menaquinone biosynthesis C-methylase UbiE
VANIEELPTDGERYLPGMGGRIAAEHLARYAFAEQFIAGKDVLDVASGEGYGTAIMATKAHSITGVDLAEAAVLFAQKKYSKVKNAKFQVGDLTAIPFDSDRFDVVTCYETIEHVDEPLKAITEAKRVLKGNGILIVSTPNKENYSDRFEYDNPFHKKELGFGEFKSALQDSFEHVRFFGQFSSAASCIFDVKESGRWSIPDQESDVTHANVAKWTNNASSGDADPLYFVAVCSDHPLRNEIEAIEFFDASDWRSIEDEFLLRKTGAQLQSQNDNVTALRGELQATQTNLQSLQVDLQATKDILNRRDTEIQTLRLAFNSLRGQHTRLNKEIEAKTAELSAIISSTTWRLSSVLRNKLMRSPFLRKVLRRMYVAIATKR